MCGGVGVGVGGVLSDLGRKKTKQERDEGACGERKKLQKRVCMRLRAFAPHRSDGLSKGFAGVRRLEGVAGGVLESHLGGDAV